MRITVGELRSLIQEKLGDELKKNVRQKRKKNDFSDVAPTRLTVKDVFASLDPSGRHFDKENTHVYVPNTIVGDFRIDALTDERYDELRNNNVTPFMVLQALRTGSAAQGKVTCDRGVQNEIIRMMAIQIARKVRGKKFDAVLSVESGSTFGAELASLVAEILGNDVIMGHIPTDQGGLRKSPETVEFNDELYGDYSDPRRAENREKVIKGISNFRNAAMAGGERSMAKALYQMHRKYVKGYHKLGDAAGLGLENVLVIDDNIDKHSTFRDVKRELDSLGINGVYAAGYSIGQVN